MTTATTAEKPWLLFDWGNTLMREDPSAEGPMAFWPRVEAIPGAFEVLTKLRPSWRMALATNAEASDEAQIWAALRRVDLDKLIDKIFCFRSIGYKKPSREFFIHVVDELEVTADQVVMVGDVFDIDVVGANRSGMRAIWLNENSDLIRTGALHRTIRSLLDLPNALTEFVS